MRSRKTKQQEKVLRFNLGAAKSELHNLDTIIIKEKKKPTQEFKDVKSIMQAGAVSPASIDQRGSQEFGQPEGVWVSSCLLTQGHPPRADGEQSH